MNTLMDNQVGTHHNNNLQKLIGLKVINFHYCYGLIQNTTGLNEKIISLM